MQRIHGIHHITAISGEPNRNLRFYLRILGLRLVKRTVNFDDPGTHHLYYGDETGSPGTILTFFPIPEAPRGIPGAGQTSAVTFAVPADSLRWWAEHLSAHGVAAGREVRFGDSLLTLHDPDGLPLELVARADSDPALSWVGGPIPAEHAIRGFFGVTLREREIALTANLLTEDMGAMLLAEEDGRRRYAVGADRPGAYVDLIDSPEAGRGRVAVGSVHHVAFRTPSDAEQATLLNSLTEAGARVTPVQDRQYFRSIYFREPGGVLFEIATDPPGFQVDEDIDSLGTSLRLPPWLETSRDTIEQELPELTLPELPQ